MHVYMYVCMYMCVCMSVTTHRFMRICTCICMCVCVCARARERAHTHIDTPIFADIAIPRTQARGPQKYVSVCVGGGGHTGGRGVLLWSEGH